VRRADNVKPHRGAGSMPVERRNRRRLCAYVRLAVLTGHCWHRLVKQRKIELRDVDQLEVGVTALTRYVVRPLSDYFTVPTRARAPDDDGDSQHPRRPNAMTDRGVMC
jgi:hypothetical protein